MVGGVPTVTGGVATGTVGVAIGCVGSAPDRGDGGGLKTPSFLSTWKKNILRKEEDVDLKKMKKKK